MTQLRRLGYLACGLVALACNKEETVESEDVRTSGIYPEFSVLATGDGKVAVSATLKVGGDDANVYLDLTGSDELVCSNGSDEITLSAEDTAYTGSFSADDDGTVFTFSFNRGSADEEAPDSHVTLPDGFELSGGGADVQISRASDSLTVTWDPSDASDSLTWSLDGDCLFVTSGDVAEDGTLTLEGSDFDGTPSADETGADEATANCEAELCIERKLTGTLDAAFADNEGGEISAVQRRCTTFTSTP